MQASQLQQWGWRRVAQGRLRSNDCDTNCVTTFQGDVRRARNVVIMCDRATIDRLMPRYRAGRSAQDCGFFRRAARSLTFSAAAAFPYAGV